VTIRTPTNSYGPFSGNTNPGQFVLPAGNCQVMFTTDGSTTSTGFTISLTTTPEVTYVLSQQSINVQPKQQGGFVYFGLQNANYGSQFLVQIIIHTYSGLQPPTLFTSVNSFPTLEQYSYSNQTVPYGDGYQAFLTINNPPSGTYYMGLFMYGSSSSIEVFAEWMYNLPLLQSGVKVTNSTGSVPIIYQLLVPTDATSLVFQISRQVPGGYPVAYISQGVVPTATNFGWVMDTSQQSYIRLSIPNPNPYYNTSPNPGNYIISISEKVTKKGEFFVEDTERHFEPLNSGFILQADWY